MKLVLRGFYDDNNKNTLKSDYTRPWCVCARAWALIYVDFSRKRRRCRNDYEVNEMKTNSIAQYNKQAPVPAC